MQFFANKTQYMLRNAIPFIFSMLDLKTRMISYQVIFINSAAQKKKL